MKRIWISILILTLTLGAALWNGRYLRALTGSMADELGRAQQLAEAGETEPALALTQQVCDRWETRQNYFCTVARHSDTDDIRVGFQEVLQLLRWPDELPEYTAANTRLCQQLELLAEMEQFNVKNLF